MGLGAEEGGGCGGREGAVGVMQVCWRRGGREVGGVGGREGAGAGDGGRYAWARARELRPAWWGLARLVAVRVEEGRKEDTKGCTVTRKLFKKPGVCHLK